MNVCQKYIGVKLLKISYVRILFLVSLLFVAVINPLINFKFLNILVAIWMARSAFYRQLLTMPLKAADPVGTPRDINEMACVYLLQMSCYMTHDS